MARRPQLAIRSVSPSVLLVESYGRAERGLLRSFRLFVVRLEQNILLKVAVDLAFVGCLAVVATARPESLIIRRCARDAIQVTVLASTG